MPARAKPAVSAATPRATRTSKEKARVTIKNATVPKFKVPRPSDRVPAAPERIRSPISHPVVTPIESGESSSDNESPPNDRDDLMDGIERMVRDTMSEVFANRDEKEKEKNFATTETARVPGRYSDEGIDPFSLPSFVSPPVAAPHNILSHYPWVGQDTVDLIALGKFDIENLPKLHRTDELRNSYLKRSLKGIYQPLEGGAAEIIIGTTKLQSSFKDPTTFFLAWHIYVSIRVSFKPALAAGLANWTERVLYFVQLNYPWASILEYIIAYYQKYQNSSDPDAWFEPNPTLIAYHITLSQQKVSTAPAPPPHYGSHNGSKPKFNSQRSESIADEICLMYNRLSGCVWKDKKGGKCPRRHVCVVCTSPQHTALACPGKSTK